MQPGFEKMDSGLKENFPDRVSPIKAHVDGLRDLGAETGPLNPHVNAVTSDVVRVSQPELVLSAHMSAFECDYPLPYADVCMCCTRTL